MWISEQRTLNRKFRMVCKLLASRLKRKLTVVDQYRLIQSLPFFLVLCTQKTKNKVISILEFLLNVWRSLLWLIGFLLHFVSLNVIKLSKNSLIHFFFKTKFVKRKNIKPKIYFWFLLLSVLLGIWFILRSLLLSLHIRKFKSFSLG